MEAVSNREPVAALARLRSQVECLEQAGYSESAAVQLARAVLQSSPGTLGTGPLPSCDDCQAALPDHIEAELNHRPGPRYRAMRRHLDLCVACGTAYLDLLEVALLAEKGTLPRPTLTVDLSFLEQASTEDVI